MSTSSAQQLQSSAPDSGAVNTPNLSVVPPPEPKVRSPFALNRAQAAEVNKARAIAAVSKQAAYAPKLAEHDISAAFITTLEEDILTANARAIGALNCTTERKACTEAEADTQRTLMRSLRQIQTAAKQKFRYTEPVRLDDYLIGERIDENRALLEQSSQAIIAKATADALPGINAAFITRVTNERTAYVNSKTVQETEGERAKAERVVRNECVESIKQRRIEIQFAANAAWPPGIAANAPIRTRFFLQPNRPPAGSRNAPPVS